MSDLLVHLILDGPPDGYPGVTEQGPAMLRIVTAPTMGARYNKLFSFRRPASLLIDRNLTIRAINDAVLSGSDAERALGSRAGRQLKRHGGWLYRELCDSSDQQFLWQTELFRRKLLLLLQFGDGATDLASCYWEALYDQGADKFLGHAGTVARYIPAGRADAAPPGQLRVLVAISTYGPGGDIDGEMVRFAKDDLDGLRRSLEPVDVLENPSPSELAAALQKNVNSFHFFGHGGVCPNRGPYLVLRSEEEAGTWHKRAKSVNDGESRGRPAYFEALSNIFNPADTKELQLVVINACQLEEQAALGARLVGRFGIPGVITMRARIGTQVIADRHGFTETLYRYIVEGKAVHEAYGAALARILYWSPVETFVPTLTLGTADPLFLVDPNLKNGWNTAMLSRTGRYRHPPTGKS